MKNSLRNLWTGETWQVREVMDRFMQVKGNCYDDIFSTYEFVWGPAVRLGLLHQYTSNVGDGLERIFLSDKGAEYVKRVMGVNVPDASHSPSE